jgi:hypothetical protein
VPTSLPIYNRHRDLRFIDDYQLWQNSKQLQRPYSTDLLERDYVRIQESMQFPRYSAKHISIERFWSRKDSSRPRSDEREATTRYRPPSYQVHRREVQQRIKKQNAMIAQRSGLEGVRKKVRFKGVDEELSKCFGHLRFDK